VYAFGILMWEVFTSKITLTAILLVKTSHMRRLEKFSGLHYVESRLLIC
jgi:hypothetical protein